MEEKVETEIEALEKEAKALGIKKSRIAMAGFSNKKGRKPVEIVKESARAQKKANGRLARRVETAKAKAKMKPIDKRKALLVSRFKAVKSRTRPRTYTDKNIKAWLEELDMIERNPKSWNSQTKKGTIPFVPSNKKKKTAQEILDGMDLSD